ncbi:MAG: hypothetical protein ABIV05_04585, partial [Actinomycetota bacterium]
ETAPAAPAPVGVMSMDILPARSSGRGLRLRRPGKAKAAPMPPLPPSRLPVPTRSAPAPAPAPSPVAASPQPVASAVEAPTWDSATPVADAAPFAGSPFTQMVAETATPVQAAPTEPIAAPPSLFATATSADVAPPADQPVLDQPVFSRPLVDQPVFGQPVSEPMVSRPVAAEPTLDQPVFGQPLSSEPAFSQPVVQPREEQVVPTPAMPVLGAAQSLRERSARASEALSELSALSTYRPEALPTAAANLVRRTPLASAAGKPPAPAQEPDGPRRGNRNAADVRSMLSGFQAGVERGRTSPGAPRSTPGTGQ